MSLEQAQEVRQCARDAVEFYAERVGYASLALEIEISLSHHWILEKHITTLERAIARHHQQAYPNDVLQSIPGVGRVVGSVVRATIGDARNFTNASALRAYAGLVPREDSSGDTRRRERISKAGPNLLRWALYLAGDTARKHDPHLADLYRGLMVERGRHHDQALWAVATHLSDRIYAIISWELTDGATTRVLGPHERNARADPISTDPQSWPLEVSVLPVITSVASAIPGDKYCHSTVTAKLNGVSTVLPPMVVSRTPCTT